MRVRREDFQSVLNGKQIDLFVLKNRNGIEVAITNYGGIVVSIMCPDKNGDFDDIVCGHETLEEYLHTAEPTLGSVIGRYGNRIADAKFGLGRETYILAKNNGENSLHGGVDGFNKQVWNATMLNAQCLNLTYTSKDGEEGFPGTLNVRVVYTLYDDNSLEVSYIAVCDKTTVVNLTQHSYFNLSGHKSLCESICDHYLQINASNYIPTDKYNIPYGTIETLKDTPLDFSEPHKIGQRINDDNEQLKYGYGYDHCYVIDKKIEGEFVCAAKVYDEKSGRVMYVSTTEPGLQLYTANYLNVENGKYGCSYGMRSALCLEAQHFPNSPNVAYFPSVVLRRGEFYKQRTVYKFTVEDLRMR